MKYICEKNCFVRNPQGIFQRFNVGDEVDFGDAENVSAHFKCLEGGGSSNLNKKGEKEEMQDKLKNIGVVYSPKDSLSKLRTLLKEAA